MSNAPETLNLIDPETLPANYNTDLLFDSAELAKYSVPKNYHADTSTGYADDYFNDDNLNFANTTPEQIGQRVIDIIEKYRTAKHYQKERIGNISRLHVSFQILPIMTADLKRRAITAAVRAKKAAIAAKARRKAETLRKAQQAVKALQAMGVNVELPDELKPKEKANTKTTKKK